MSLANLSNEELLALSKKEKNARKRIRLLSVFHVLSGKSRYKVAASLSVSRRSVNEWVTSYLKFGVSGLEAKKPTGRPSYLSPKQKKQLAEFIDAQSHSADGGRLTGQAIVNYINEEFGLQYHHNSIYKILKSLGFSWITSRSMHPKQDEKAQADFKKTLNRSD